MSSLFRTLSRRLLPAALRRRIIYLTRWPPVGRVRFGHLRRLQPISTVWGSDRGAPVDRYYIENFLEACKQDVRGRVLEIGDSTYTRRYGGDRVVESVVLHVGEKKKDVTLIGDLTVGDNLPENAFDCVIVTQTLQTIFDVPAAIRTIFRILKPGGVCLVTIPGISKISRYDMDRWGYYWSFTTRSAEELFAKVFPRDCIEVRTHGNVLASIAFLAGLAAQELTTDELDYVDPDYQLLITIRATKPLESK